jgi:hypothetical protein
MIEIADKPETYCIGYQWYIKTRGLSDYSVNDYRQRRANQHATSYIFDDNSSFIVYRNGGAAYRNPNGFIMAARIAG